MASGAWDRAELLALAGGSLRAVSHPFSAADFRELGEQRVKAVIEAGEKTALQNVIKSDHAQVPASPRIVSLRLTPKPERSSPQANLLTPLC